jgi:hypothetical protein
MMRDRISRAAILWALLLVFAFSMPALARNGFSLSADGSARILLFRPKITVGAQSTGGMFEPRPEWTEQPRKNIDDVVRQVDAIGPDAQAVAAYQVLFDVVAQPVITYQFFNGNRLATKKRDNRNEVFD